MAQIAYVNGRYDRLAAAGVSVEDRGFQFGDGVYEVVAVLNGQMLDLDGHLTRLARSCSALAIAVPMGPRALSLVMREVLRRNRITNGILYQQVTRGAARRDHVFPAVDTPPSLVMTARGFDFTGKAQLIRTGVGVLVQPDIRWGRCDIKTINLLPNVLAKQAAKAGGAYEALYVDGDIVTEGGSTTMWMVDASGTVHTHPNGPGILPGIMRATLLQVAAAAQIKVVEAPFGLTAFRSAPEAFLTSTTAPCLPVTQVDGAPIGSGRPGPVTLQLARLMWDEIARQTGYQLPAGTF